MRMNSSKIVVLVIGMIFLSQCLLGQASNEREDDLGDNEDRYQELFFEALKQKGIENYERAVDALQECLKLDDSDPVLYFELGKNYNKLKNFGAAEDALKKAISFQPDNEWFLDELYDTYFLQNDIDNAIKTVKQLVKFHPDYKQDLASLYIREKKYKEALKLLDELDKDLGTNEIRDDMRDQIYNVTGNADDRIENLELRVSNNPNNEDNYLKLIYRYSQSGESEKAFNTARKLLEVKPDSKLVHLALYKFYLNKDQTSEAINSMKLVLRSSDINPDAKAKVLKDFVAFVAKNPEYEKDLVEVTSEVEQTQSPKALADLGDYYLKSGDKSKALGNYKSALKQDPNNFKLLKSILLLELDFKNFDETVSQSESALELYPAQPILYLINGVAYNNLNKAKKAINSLEMGLDYLIDDPNMESDFYNQLSIAYKLNNNITKSQAFAKKAEALKLQQ